MQASSWMFALALLIVAAASAAATLWLMQARKPGRAALPSEWAVSARPVFNNDERRVYRQLRDALPHHIILSKLPLVRFCQPEDHRRVKYWYELLGNLNVSFAVCSANGRMLAAIDLDTDRTPSRRALQIKQSVLGACRVRYLRIPVDHLPSLAELQLLVPQTGGATRAPQTAAAHTLHRQPAARPAAARRSDTPRAPRTALWQDSNFFQDSFFGSDPRQDSQHGSSEFGALDGSGGPSSTFGNSTFGPMGNTRRPASRPTTVDVPLGDDDIVGVVVDSQNRHASRTRH